MPSASPLPHHIATTAGGRPEQSGSAHIYIGTTFYAGENHKVEALYAATEQLANDEL